MMRSASSNCASSDRWLMSPVWIMKAGFFGSALTLAMASSSVPSAFGLAGLSKPTWLSLICRKLRPRTSCALASPMRPSECGTPPETVHSTPVPTQVMHSSTLRRLTPSSRSDSLIASLLRSQNGRAMGLLGTRAGDGGFYSRIRSFFVVFGQVAAPSGYPAGPKGLAGVREQSSKRRDPEWCGGRRSPGISRKICSLLPRVTAAPPRSASAAPHIRSE